MELLRVDSANARLRYSMVAGVACALLLATSLALLFCLRYRPQRLGRARADVDWVSHCAVVFTSQVQDYTAEGQFRITQRYDPGSGLRRHQVSKDTLFFRAYNDRIRELIEEHGVPLWSAKKAILADVDLIALLRCPSMQVVTTFPYKVSPSIVVRADIHSGRRLLTIVSKNQQYGDFVWAATELDGDVYFGHAPPPSEALLIRVGGDWMAVYTDDGRHVADVVRESSG